MSYTRMIHKLITFLKRLTYPKSIFRFQPVQQSSYDLWVTTQCGSLTFTEILHSTLAMHPSIPSIAGETFLWRRWIQSLPRHSGEGCSFYNALAGGTFCLASKNVMLTTTKVKLNRIELSQSTKNWKGEKNSLLTRTWKSVRIQVCIYIMNLLSIYEYHD